ncbi:MAG TPA: hypothetical protein VK176_03240 [Phycisphaerales bacterium]|nr:hypothetical protein [Phycisphaerales bacterium]
MGTWTLERIVTENSNFDTTELFGTNFRARFWLRYSPGILKKFKEMPMLDWHERILMREHHKNQWWVFETNMYEHNPLSNTLKVWPRRYIAAYDRANGYIEPGMKGYAKLHDQDGRPVPIEKLGAADTEPKKAEAVRSYLKNKGGIMIIEIHDIPSILIPKNGEHKERLLKFNVGVKGQQLRGIGEQYLVVNQALPKTGWTRQFNGAWTTVWNPGTSPKVEPPTSVSAPRDAMFSDGEYW